MSVKRQIFINNKDIDGKIVIIRHLISISMLTRIFLKK